MFVIPRPGCLDLWVGQPGENQGAVAIDNGT